MLNRLNRLNKKGEVLAFAVAMMVIAGASLVALPFKTKEFRQRKYVEKCVSQTNDLEACQSQVSGLSQKDIVAYIRDI